MFVRLNGSGIRLYFDIEGAGLVADGNTMREKPTVVLVHGGPGGDHTFHKPAFSELSDIAQILYYDHRGNGRSELADSDSWNLAQWGDDLRDLCDTLGIEKPIVIGTSFGGFVTLSYATRHPDHAGKLILISTAAKVEFSEIYDAFERLGGAEIRAVAERYWNTPSSESRTAYAEHCVPFYHAKAGDVEAMLARSIRRDAPALWFNGPHNEQGRMDFRNELADIRCPVLVLAGAQDPITPPVFNRQIAEKIRSDRVTFRLFENCGHGVVADQPEAAFAAMREFILSKDAQGSDRL